MNAREASRKRSAEDAGHEADGAGRGGVQPDPGSIVGDSMPELRREAEALGADAVALAEGVFWRIQIECRCDDGSAFGMGSGAASPPGQSREEVEGRETAFAHFESHMLGSLSATTHQARRVGRIAGAGQASLGVCMQSGRIANQARWTRSL